MFRIESNIPLPPIERTGRPRGSKYPFARMKVGDSVFFGKKSPTVVRAAIRAMRDHIKTARFATRKVTENGVTGLRVWRIK